MTRLLLSFFLYTTSHYTEARPTTQHKLGTCPKPCHTHPTKSHEIVAAMVLIEVEQKFSWTQAKLASLTFGTGRPLFKSMHYVNGEALRDTYFDKNNKLSASGLWLRKREHLAQPGKFSDRPGEPQPATNVLWQAKQSKKGNSYLRSTFEETEDNSQILEMVRSHYPKCPDARKDFGLDVLAKFETLRCTFFANDKFTVTMDYTDFDHIAGEVELLVRPEDVDKAHADIDEFLEEYAWFFDASNLKGKLTAYFEKFGYPKEEPSTQDALR